MRKKVDKKKKITTIFLLFLFAVTVGYAIVSTQLKLDGNLAILKQTWDVHFENVQIKSGSVPATVAPASDNATTTVIPYTVSFTNPGDFYEFTVEVVNRGTIDAMADIVTNQAYESDGTTPITAPYLVSSVTYANGNPIEKYNALAVGEVKRLKVRVEFNVDNVTRDDLPSESDITVLMKLSVPYVQADSNAVAVDDTPIIASCPGCVYASPTSDLEWKYGNSGTILNANQYKKNYEDVLNEYHKNNFVGMILNNNRISRAFACAIKNDTPFCLEGLVNEETTVEKLNQVFNSNVSLVQSAELWNGTCTADESGTPVYCGNHDPITVLVASGGDVSISEDYTQCAISSYSGIICYNGE